MRVVRHTGWLTGAGERAAVKPCAQASEWERPSRRAICPLLQWSHLGPYGVTHLSKQDPVRDELSLLVDTGGYRTGGSRRRQEESG